MRYNTVFGAYLLFTFPIMYLFTETKGKFPVATGILLVIWFVLGTVLVVLKYKEDREEMIKGILDSKKTWKELSPVTIYSIVVHAEDGSAYPHYYKSKEDIIHAYGVDYGEEGDYDGVYTSWYKDEGCGGFAEMCISELETYEGSNIHLEAVKNTRNLEIALRLSKDEMQKYYSSNLEFFNKKYNKTFENKDELIWHILDEPIIHRGKKNGN